MTRLVEGGWLGDRLSLGKGREKGHLFVERRERLGEAINRFTHCR